MRRISKVISGLISIVMVLALAGCGSTTPTSEVKKYFKTVVAGEAEEINNMVDDAINKSVYGDVTPPSEEDGDGMTDETIKILDEIVSKMEYKVNSEEVDGDTAKVNVTVNGGNISMAFMGYLGDLMTLSYTSDVLTTTPKAEYNLLVNSLIWEKFNAIEYDERTLDINLIKESNKWQIENDAALYELLLGSSTNTEVGVGQ